MESHTTKHGYLRNILVRAFLFSVAVILLRFAYIVTIRGESCDIGDFCFFSIPENFTLVTGIHTISQVLDASASSSSSSSSDHYLWTTKEYRKAVHFFSSVFQDLIVEGFLSSSSKSLCMETLTGQDVYALKELGVSDSIGTAKRAFKPLVVKTQSHRFDDDIFDFIFCGIGGMDKSAQPFDIALEMTRMVKPEGFLVVHIPSVDTYSFNSFLDLFDGCELVKHRDIDGLDSSFPRVREVVLKKQANLLRQSNRPCTIPGYKSDLVKKAEPIIPDEPLKPWITLKRNLKNVRYVPSMVDISFKQRYVYIDVGSRSYGSSIVSWFKKQYPKQNKTFDIYAIEADKSFYDEYRLKKGVTLLPYAAWVRNETIYFEINGEEEEAMGRGMGRIQPGQTGRAGGVVDEIQGFDFAMWMKESVTEKDFVVVKMDVEGAEFELIPRMIETGAICLVDELFLECHYNRWQKCCAGERSSKYQRTYAQCLELFSSLRERGVLVHQWW